MWKGIQYNFAQHKKLNWTEPKKMKNIIVNCVHERCNVWNSLYTIIIFQVSWFWVCIRHGLGTYEHESKRHLSYVSGVNIKNSYGYYHV